MIYYDSASQLPAGGGAGNSLVANQYNRKSSMEAKLGTGGGAVQGGQAMLGSDIHQNQSRTGTNKGHKSVPRGIS